MVQAGNGLKLRRLSTQENVALTLRDAIIDGTFAFGMTLNEKALCESLGVSRTPVREALIELQGQNLVQIVPFRGAFVFDMDEAEFEELGDYRAILETAALRAALKSDAAGLCAQLNALLEEMKASIVTRNGKAYGVLDTSFHETILSRSRNRFLIEAYRRVGGRLAALRNRIQHDAETVMGSLRKHEMIVQASEDGDVDKATALLESHIANGMRFFCERMGKFRANAART